MSLKLDHVGHVVHNIAEARKFYEDTLGLVARTTMNHPVSGSQMIFYPFAGMEIELIQPADVPEDVARQCLDQRGEGIFHLSFVPDDYDAEVRSWRGKGLSVMEVAFQSPEGPVRLAFLKPEEIHGLWIEFIDTSRLSRT